MRLRAICYSHVLALSRWYCVMLTAARLTYRTCNGSGRCAYNMNNEQRILWVFVLRCHTVQFELVAVQELYKRRWKRRNAWVYITPLCLEFKTRPGDWVLSQVYTVTLDKYRDSALNLVTTVSFHMLLHVLNTIITTFDSKLLTASLNIQYINSINANCLRRGL